MNFVPCTLRQLPDPLLIPAARTAIVCNPANAPAELLPMPRDEGEDRPLLYRLALLTGKFWGAKGVKLTVGFLDGGPSDLQARILAHMNAWAQWANVSFALTAGQAQVRITRTPGDGYWSYLGTDVLHIPQNQPTLNLDSFSMNTPESEYHRVVRHETGHTLGFPHEHMRREIVGRIDPQKAIAYFGRTQGWSADEVQQQVLTPLDEASLTATPHADVTSIMCYQLPGSITVDGQPIPGGIDIDASDAGLAGRLYPKAVAPPGPPSPPPPPPPSPPSPAAPLFTQTFQVAVPAHALFRGTAPVNIPRGSTLAVYPPPSHDLGALTMPTTNDLLAQGNRTTAAILAALAGTPASSTGLRSSVLAAPGGNVVVTFTWDAPPAGDSAVGYAASVDGGAPVLLPLAPQAYAVTLPDDTAAHTFTLAAVNAAGVGTAATLSFVPHTEPPPPPAPAAPTGLAYAVADAAAAAPQAPHALLGMSAAQWAALVSALAADVAKVLGCQVA